MTEVNSKIEDPSPDGKHIKYLPYIPWEDVKKLLRSSIHSMNFELDLLNGRAMIEKVYSDSLEEWASSLRNSLKKDKKLEYGIHKEVMWGLAEEATTNARIHRKIHDELVLQDGLQQPLKDFLSSLHPKKSFGLSKKNKSFGEEEFHQYHKSIFEVMLKDILQCKEYAEKNDTLTKRTKTICDKMNRTAKANSAYNKDLGFAPQEAELLSLEAQSSCLTSSHNSKAKSIQERIPTTMKKAANFTSNLLKQEMGRLDVVFKTMVGYLTLLLSTDEERDEYQNAVHSLIDRINAIMPEAEAIHWERMYTKIIECPSEMDCKPDVEIRTSLKTTNSNPYGYKEDVVDLFMAEESSNSNLVK